MSLQQAGGSISGVLETIEIPYQQGGDGFGQVRLEAGEKGLSLADDLRWSMNVDKGQCSNRDKLGMSRIQFYNSSTR
jgi:hypothetical protein